MEPNRYKHAVYDLHLHSCWSYDACAPVEYYFRTARELKLQAIAIADHFTMDSLPDIISASKKYPDVCFIPGAEMSVATSIGSVDLVCLGIPDANHVEIENIFELYRQWQRDYGSFFSEGMKSLGFDYSAEDRLKLLRKYRPQKIIDKQGITHVQNGVQKRRFVEMKYLSSEEEYPAFAQKVRETTAAPAYPPAEKVLPVLRQHGALIAIAHPSGYFNRNDLKRMDALREELDFEGIECAHDSIPEELTAFYRGYCVKHGLFSTAGSDCHSDPADNPCQIALGHKVAQHIGKPEWLAEIFQRLKSGARR